MFGNSTIKPKSGMEHLLASFGIDAAEIISTIERAKIHVPAFAAHIEERITLMEDKIETILHHVEAATKRDASFVVHEPGKLLVDGEVTLESDAAYATSKVVAGIEAL